MARSRSRSESESRLLLVQWELVLLPTIKGQLPFPCIISPLPFIGPPALHFVPLLFYSAYNTLDNTVHTKLDTYTPQALIPFLLFFSRKGWNPQLIKSVLTFFEATSYAFIF